MVYFWRRYFEMFMRALEQLLKEFSCNAEQPRVII